MSGCCKHHEDRAAEGRCDTCRAPLCSLCLDVNRGFCSESCRRGARGQSREPYISTTPAARSRRWPAVAVAGLLVAAAVIAWCALRPKAPAAAQDARARFDVMVARLSRAKSVSFKYRNSVRTPEGPLEVSGAVHLDGGTRASFDTHSPQLKSRIVSDGRQYAIVADSGPGTRYPVPADLNARWLAVFARDGIAVASVEVWSVLRGQPDKAIEVGDFRWIGRTSVAGRPAEVVEFMWSKPHRFSVRVWIDIERSVPLMRTLGNQSLETYTDWKLDEAVDPALFALPE